MLDALRRSASGVVAKGFLGLLVISFAVWGVADIFRNYGADSVAEVGGSEISAAAFTRAYQREMSLMADRLGRRLTADEARALGVDRRVLGELLTSAVLSNEAHNLKLGVSDDLIAKRIVSDPTFLDAFGRFDRERYVRILQYSGINESAYVADQQRVVVRDQLTEAIAGDLEPPAVLIDAMREFQGAKRVVDYVVLPEVTQAQIAAPDESALKAFYTENETRFTAPELRALTILAVEPGDVTGAVEVSEEDIATEYAARKGQYDTPERRAVDQVLFADEEAAKKAHDRIVGGEDFLKVAGDAGFTAADIDLGLVTESDIVDPKIAEAAFSLEASAVSDPIAGALGSALIRVREIKPASIRPLAEVRGEIRESIALERARDEVQDLFDAIEDDRAGGMTLAEIAAKYELDLATVDAVDRFGNDIEGEPVAGLPADMPELLRAAFESDIGLENDAVESQSGGFAWYDVTDVNPPELRPLEDVRADVETAWRESEAKERQQEAADAALARVRGGTPLATLATEVSGTVETSEPFTRRAPTTPFSPSLVEAIFAESVGAVLSGPAREGGRQAIVSIKALQPADPLAEGDTRTLLADVRIALGIDLADQYVSGLQARGGVTINEAAVSALIGEGS